MIVGALTEMALLSALPPTLPLCSRALGKSERQHSGISVNARTNDYKLLKSGRIWVLHCRTYALKARWLALICNVKFAMQFELILIWIEFFGIDLQASQAIKNHYHQYISGDIAQREPGIA